MLLSAPAEPFEGRGHGPLMSFARSIFFRRYEGSPTFPPRSPARAALFLTLLLTAATARAQTFSDAVSYGARDSTRYDLRSNRVMMFGAATVRYQDIELTAERILLDLTNEEVMAFGVLDSNGTAQGLPRMTQGGRTVDADSIRYNFRSKKGHIRDVRTTEQQLYVLAGTSKIHPDKEAHSKGGMLTTCDRPNPHYHFAVSRMMVIPDDKIVAGPAYMKIGKVPTPLAIPFGLFPNQKGGSAGVLVPVWGNSQDLGYFLLNGGYYLPIGDHFDEQLTGDIYSRGSWGLRSLTRYRSRYRFNGSLDLQYSVRNTSIPEYPDFAQQRNFFIRWNHLMDSRASLTDRFNASVNLGTSQHFTNNFNSTTGDYLSNTFNSNVSWNHLWTGKPYSFSVAMRHSQNTLNRTFDVTLPSANFNVQRFFPTTWFGRERVGSAPWYDRIGFTLNSQFDNQLRTTEDRISLENLGRLTREVRNGIRNTGTVSTSFKTRYFTVNPAANFTQRTYFDHLEMTYDPVANATRRDTLPGVSSLLDYNASMALTSKLYGMYAFKGNGRLRAVRHVITPSATLTYIPGNDTRITGPFGTDGATTTYSPYEIGIYGVPSPVESGLLNLGLLQSVEAKMRGRAVDGGEAAIKKIKLLDYLGVNANYDLLKDSVRWSPVSVAARTQLLNKLDVNVTSAWDPYATDASGRNIDRSVRSLYGSLAHLRTLTAALGFSLQSRQHGRAKDDGDDDRVVGEADPAKGARVDFNMPWQLHVNYSYNVNRAWTGPSYVEQQSQSLLFNGDITVFKHWKIGGSSGYDLQAQEWTPTSLNLYWDLHCWEFNANWIPLGVRKSFSIRINVKASVLRDLKYELRRPYGNNGDLLY